MGLSVNQFRGVRTKQMSLSVNHFNKVEKQLAHWSIMIYDGIGEEQITLGITKDSQMA